MSEFDSIFGVLEVAEGGDPRLQNVRAFERTFHRVVEAIEFEKNFTRVGCEFQGPLVGEDRATGRVQFALQEACAEYMDIVLACRIRLPREFFIVGSKSRFEAARTMVDLRESREQLGILGSFEAKSGQPRQRCVRVDS